MINLYHVKIKLEVNLFKASNYCHICMFVQLNFTFLGLDLIYCFAKLDYIVYSLFYWTLSGFIDFPNFY